MQKKIFIGIDLPQQAKKRLAQKLEKWADAPVRWVDSQTYHLTLFFLGYINGDQVMEVCDQIRKAVKNHLSFEVLLDKITIGPEGRKSNMVWATGDSNKDLQKLYESVERALGVFKVEKKSFRPHVTLGRIRAHRWEVLPEKPVIKESMRIVVPADSVQVFESVVEGGKTKFQTLESCPLQ